MSGPSRPAADGPSGDRAGVRANRAAPAARTDAPATPDEASVLVVEDQPVLVLHLCQALEEAGLCVIGPCLSYRDALASIAREPPRFAVMDIDLGQGNLSLGLEGERILAVLTNAGCGCVIHSGRSELFDTIGRYFPRATLIAKPAPLERAVEALLVPEG